MSDRKYQSVTSVSEHGSEHGSDKSGDWTTRAPTSRKRTVKAPSAASKGYFGDQLVNSLRLREAGRENSDAYSFGAQQSGEYQFPLELPALEVLQDASLRRKLLLICSRFKVSVHRNSEARELVVNAPNPEDIPPSVEAIKRLLDDTKEELERPRELYLLHPPPTALMTMEVKSQTRLSGNGKLYSPVLSGLPLHENALQTWSESRKLDIKANASEIITNIQNIGHLFLKSVHIKSLAEGFPYNAFAAMIGNPKLTSEFHDKLKGKESAKSLLSRIALDQGFEPINESVGAAAGVMPAQSLVYVTRMGGTEYKYEAALTLNARGRCNIGDGELFDTTNDGERLSVRVLNLQNFDWTFEAAPKRAAPRIPTFILDKVDKILLMLEMKSDFLGFGVPVLKARGLILDRERLYTKTTFQCRLIRLPYYIEVCLMHDIVDDNQPVFTVSIMSMNWDALAERWSGHADASFLFPGKAVEGDGVRLFMELMEKRSYRMRRWC